MSVSSAVRGAGALFAHGGAGLGEALDAFLASRPRPPRLLGLGEPTHGVEVFCELRNMVLRNLVEVWGFRSVVMESDCLAGLAVDDYVASGGGNLNEVMDTGFSHGFGDLATNRELVRWLREYNAERDAQERVRFHGFDAPMEMTGASSPRAALSGLHGYLSEHLGSVPHAWERIDALAGEDGVWTEPGAMFDPGRSVGASERARELRVVADDLAAVLSLRRRVWWRRRRGRRSSGRGCSRERLGACWDTTRSWRVWGTRTRSA
ncbi:erythromycin esterase family protein [Nocardiopsis sp. CNR-923]|uniref:erythromycin esterase family protein n=1 Tax=Nocardiopsis sp. CNR-923 TaxID=1904965 RepID=UPI000ABB6867